MLTIWGFEDLGYDDLEFEMLEGDNQENGITIANHDKEKSTLQ